MEGAKVKKIIQVQRVQIDLYKQSPGRIRRFPSNQTLKSQAKSSQVSPQVTQQTNLLSSQRVSPAPFRPFAGTYGPVK